MVLPFVDAAKRRDRRRSTYCCDTLLSRIRSSRKNSARAALLCALVFILASMLNAFQIIGKHNNEEYTSLNLLDEKDARLPIDLARTTKNTERAIFYNIFVPRKDDDDGENDDGRNPEGSSESKREYALELVEEQLRYHDAASDFVRATPIYFTLIGDTTASKDVEGLCARVAEEGRMLSKNNDNDNNNNLREEKKKTTCQPLRSVETGDEGLTLESLYDYCGEHPRSQVTYLHNKGSFHPSVENTAMRRMLTRSVFSDSCQAIPLGQCNVCAARFSPLPHTHMTGNMWTADCSYVNKLIHPLEFPTRMDEMVRHALSLQNESVFPLPHRNYMDRPWDYGLQRFGFEHWVGSHPHLKPCDVYPNAAYAYGFANLDTTAFATPPSSVAVRGNTHKEGSYKPILRKVPWMPLERFWHWSFNEWMCGRGRLAQYKYLYGTYPGADSFLWAYYETPFRPPFKNLYSLLFDRGCPVPIRKSDYL